MVIQGERVWEKCLGKVLRGLGFNPVYAQAMYSDCGTSGSTTPRAARSTMQRLPSGIVSDELYAASDDMADLPNVDGAQSVWAKGEGASRARERDIISGEGGTGEERVGHSAQEEVEMRARARRISAGSCVSR